MTRFLDGPAAGQVLWLRRSPVMLRVVLNGNEWDALDQLDDVPKPEERIYLYRCIGGVQWVHCHGMVNARNGWFAQAEYRLVPEQPDDADMRTTDAWWKWCEAQREKGGVRS